MGNNLGAQTVMYGVIYKAINTVNGKVYVGQTVQRLSDRIRGHITSSKTPKLSFSKAIAKYGKDSFKWEVVDSAVSKEELDSKESYWITYYNSRDPSFGYNLREGGSKGKASESTKEKMRLAQIGRKMPEHLRLGLIGHTLSQDAKDRISRANKGRVQSDEERSRRAASRPVGYKHSEVTKKLLSERAKARYESPEERLKLSLIFKGRVISEDTKLKIKEARKRQVMHPVTQQTKDKISAANKGRIKSEEERARLSASARARYSKERQRSEF